MAIKGTPILLFDYLVAEWADTFFLGDRGMVDFLLEMRDREPPEEFLVPPDQRCFYVDDARGGAIGEFWQPDSSSGKKKQQ